MNAVEQIVECGFVDFNRCCFTWARLRHAKYSSVEAFVEKT